MDEKTFTTISKEYLKKCTGNIYTQKGQKGTNLLEILHWFLCCGDKHFEVIGAVFNFNDSFDDLVITSDYNKNGRTSLIIKFNMQLRHPTNIKDD